MVGDSRQHASVQAPDAVLQGDMTGWRLSHELLSYQQEHRSPGSTALAPLPPPHTAHLLLVPLHLSA